MARGSILYTPFYCQGGWDFLDKYFEHKRLVTPKGQKYDYEEERAKFCKLSGFDKMWACVRTIETCWLKYQKNMRKYGNVHENLQIYVDEQVFRAQNNTLAKKREALCAAFDCDQWNPAEDNGIGGGYGQFGVLTEEEMNQCLKGDGERVRKFTEHEDQHKEKYNHTRKLFRERCK